MQNLVTIYEENAELIQKFIISSLKRISLSALDESVAGELFSIFPSLELLYECDEGFVQVSENFSPSGRAVVQAGIDRSYLVDAEALREGCYFHDPYISAATGSLCMTVVCRTAGGYLFLDFRLRSLLERFDLIEKEGGLSTPEPVRLCAHRRRAAFFRFVCHPLRLLLLYGASFRRGSPESRDGLQAGDRADAGAGGL